MNLNEIADQFPVYDGNEMAGVSGFAVVLNKEVISSETPCKHATVTDKRELPWRSGGGFVYDSILPIAIVSVDNADWRLHAACWQCIQEAVVRLPSYGFGLEEERDGG